MEKTINQKGKTEIKDLSIYIQMIVMSLIIIFGIMYFFIPEIVFILELLVAIFLLLSAINNYKVYKKPYMTFLYTFVAILYLISIVLDTFAR